MKVTDVMQKSILEVAEWGVTAAAAVEGKFKIKINISFNFGTY